MRKPAICPVGRAAAPVKSEKLELGRGAVAVSLEVVVDRLDEGLRKTGGGGDAEETSRAGEDGGMIEGDGPSEEDSAKPLEGGATLDERRGVLGG